MADTPRSSLPGQEGQPGQGMPGISTTSYDDVTLGFLPSEQPETDAELETSDTLWAVVFAGGIGSRFWPLSTPERPKPLLRLVGDRPLIADTLRRLQPLIPAERTLVLTSADIADAIRAAIPELPEKNMLVEPRPLGTAAALAWGAQEIVNRMGRSTVFCALHADLSAQFEDEFRRSIRRAATYAAGEDAPLVAIGARPVRPDTGFGYMLSGSELEPGISVAQGGACIVSRFVEKPGPLQAEEFINDGALWNAGIYCWQAGAVLDALEANTTELADGLAYLFSGKVDRFFGMVQSISIERGLLERIDTLVCVPSSFGWDDVGTWACLRRVRELDDTGNGVIGDALLVDAESNVVHTESGRVVVYGVNSLLVVSLPGVTFVTSLERAAELAPLFEGLPKELRRNPTAEM
ncbi:MAG TPA: sugar phosphate nucleotidyltransferase [Gemmatimonadaceae bacterium]|nr:sugar phosphate nucleotidyltransferase [Gemmatimonadaceae bacterium]